MQEATSRISFDQYPTQIRFLAVQELWIKTLVPPSVDQPIQSGPIQINTSVGPYVPENKTIQITLSAELGSDVDPSKIIEHLESGGPPFVMRVRLVGEFLFDDSRFPMEKVDRWAKENAPIILFPYLREQVFSLTARAGYRPLILPLVQVPTLTIAKHPESEQRPLDLKP